MAKKKAAQAAKSTKRNTAGKKAAAKKPAAKKKAAAKVKRATQKAVTKKKAGKSKAASPAKAPAAVSLGRPKVTGEEKLYMLFKDDYHARQVFEFLRVETVKDLEQFAPQEIVHRLSLPIRQTVDRIRRLLAEKNRSLKDDREFALNVKRES